MDTLWKALEMPWEVLGTPWVDVWGGLGDALGGLGDALGGLKDALGGPSGKALGMPQQELPRKAQLKGLKHSREVGTRSRLT